MKTNQFLAAWQQLSENKGTINKCLVDFKNTCEMKAGSDNDFIKYCLSVFADYDSNKALNGAYYNKIKEFAHIGEERATKRGDKIYISTIKCSEYTIFRYFWAKYNGR